jgi:hypothetical protein
VKSCGRKVILSLPLAAGRSSAIYGVLAFRRIRLHSRAQHRHRQLLLFTCETV